MISPAEVSPPYFTTGFPYEKDEFLSYAGSCWAVMALLTAGQNSLNSGFAFHQSRNEVPWARIALFGTSNELKALLDAGLDPNSQTARGTTPLMMAAPDADKVRLLIGRGADVKSRSAAGTDAVTIATAHYGTSASVRLLLEAGAEARAPERGRHAPLQYASMSGDMEAVRVLLARGAEASAEAVSEAGVPLDATDDYGYTPLMYAATVDEGDTATLKALLAAGADRRIRNDEGRTPLEQARRYKHAQIADALK